MKRLITLTMVAAFIALGAGIVMSAAVKVDLVPWGTGVTMVPDASGQAILNYAKGKAMTEVQVNCWDLTPDTDYMVYLGYMGGPWQNIGTFTTRKNGSGNLHIRLDGDLSGVPKVAVNAPFGGTVLLNQ